MTFQIGTDEAGYGPNLGPLTVAATLWKIDTVSIPDVTPLHSPSVDLYEPLKAVITSNPSARTESRMLIADSKIVYGSSKKISNLETPVLALIYVVLGFVPRDWSDLIDAICPTASVVELKRHAWLFERRLLLPVMSDEDQIKRLGDHFSAACERAGVGLLHVNCTPVFPDTFNEQIVSLGNKASLLSTTTLKIVRQLLDQAPGDVFVGCDKHGGRSKYAGLIQNVLTEQFVSVGTESLAVSHYQFRESNRNCEIRFEAKGESFLPIALASMIAKYVREVFMILWNDYWRLHLPDIKPTQGYPQDAKRFKREIEAKQRELKISDNSIWRNK